MNKAIKALNVIGICGSLRQDSYSRMALSIALQGAAERGAGTRIIDLNDYDLVFADGRDTPYPAGVQRLKEHVKAADGIIIATPEYHSGMSGVLKNAIDLMGFDQFGGKMIGLVGVSGGAMGAVNALNSLRAVGRSLHAWVIPHQVSIPEAWKLFNQQGQLTDQNIQERLLEVGRQVARFSFLHTSQEVREFLEMWEQAPPNPGG
ncbi:MAG: NADPH-dependent FMN reductase [Anaerolineales bacterium]|jgi:FMN reductase